ncbi:transmembrane protein 202-like isoform X2 [Trichosurus vulpecula]|uniref:transmembrane protein 202-like isoform X2 n=1 Tax=Trichosurus vulpecula TaxID=9337 RepID=UPI00186ABDE1|nr:transmembrane protein 202-like isoform X2 [Trichosurus vulpecula]
MSHISFIKNLSSSHHKPHSSIGGEFGGWKGIQRHRTSVLPLSHRLLHQARHLNRELCLLLSLCGLAITGLLCLSKSWIRFHVPVGTPGNFTFIDIYTSLFVPCPETECTLEPDQPPYYLNYSVVFILIASLIGFLLCLALVYSVLFFTGSVPIFDLSTSIASFFTGLFLFLCALFYLLQAQNFLQEGMSYTLEINYYLTWAGIFLFMMTGFLCFLNYLNFWSIITPGGSWL